MRIGYIRVSSLDQNTDRQHEILKQYALEKIFEEKISGKDRNRPALQEMMKFCRDGDTIYIESISRRHRFSQRESRHRNTFWEVYVDRFCRTLST